VFVNHKPAFGLQPELIRWAFDVLGGSVERDELLQLLQTRGPIHALRVIVSIRK